MDKSLLIATLRQLHEELNDLENADQETLNLLKQVTSDVERITSAQPAESESDDDAEPQVTEPVSTLRSLLLRFETDHPELAKRIGEVGDCLSNMGI